MNTSGHSRAANKASSKVPEPLVIDLKSSKLTAKENVNSKDEEDCLVIVDVVQKQPEVRGTKRKRDVSLQQSVNKICNNVTDDSVIIIDDAPEDLKCKKRHCGNVKNSVVIIEDSPKKRKRKPRSKKSSVLGMRRMKGKKLEECKTSSSESQGKSLPKYEPLLKKDFIPLNCAGVATYTYVNEQAKHKISDTASLLPVYVDKRTVQDQQSTSQNTAPQQQSVPVGGNICTLKKKKDKQTGLRPIVIDGSNVAMGHTNGTIFSCEGLKICIDYFLERKHEVLAFVPRYRQGRCTSTDLLSSLQKRGLVAFTPSRRVDGKLEVSYDDRFIVQYAAASGGVIVSTDQYRDLQNENPSWKDTIKNRLLMFTWAGDMLMFPHDPLGRGGPTLEEFLKFPD